MPKKKIASKRLFACTMLFILFAAVNGEATVPGSHYTPGGEGVDAASLPPPGFHYRMYNLFYSANTLKNDEGEKLDVDYNVKIFGTVQRFVKVYDKKIFGGYYSWDIAVPLLMADVEIGAAGIEDDRQLSMGDIVLEPFALSWHGAWHDATFGLAAILPTGEFDKDKPASPGLGYFSGMVTAGATVFFDKQRTLSFSALSRVLVNSEQSETQVAPGSEFIVDWGFGKTFQINKKLFVRPGISGYGSWQISDDSDDLGNTLKDERKQVLGFGGEVNFFFLPPTSFQANLRVLRQFEARNSPEGSQIIITLTKSW